MKRKSTLAEAIGRITNISEFCRVHGLPLRTVMRIKAGGRPNTMTALALTQALERKK